MSSNDEPLLLGEGGGDGDPMNIDASDIQDIQGIQGIDGVQSIQPMDGAMALDDVDLFGDPVMENALAVLPSRPLPPKQLSNRGMVPPGHHCLCVERRHVD
jgi:mediator of RNA polymerase II transcription subunit 16, fungi type